jgi:hypothetical protein
MGLGAHTQTGQCDMPSLPPSPPARSQHYGPERGLFGRTITVWLRGQSQRPVIMRLFESKSVDSLYQDVELHDGDVLLGVGKAFNHN